MKNIQYNYSESGLDWNRYFSFFFSLMRLYFIGNKSINKYNTITDETTKWFSPHLRNILSADFY